MSNSIKDLKKESLISYDIQPITNNGYLILIKYIDELKTFPPYLDTYNKNRFFRGTNMEQKLLNYTETLVWKFKRQKT